MKAMCVLTLMAGLCLAPTHGSAQTAPQNAAAMLTDTPWQLVAVRGRDGTTSTPRDGAKYTVEFQADGRLSARIDCNGGRGRWTSPQPQQLHLGVLGLTRVRCGPGSLHDQMVKDWGSLRSYVIKGDRLFLASPASGGTYEFKPIAPAGKGPVTAAVATRGPLSYECTRSGRAAERLVATFYQTEPAMVLVERGGQMRPAFLVPAASGARYAGSGVTFWERGDEVSALWSGTELTCHRP